MHFARGNGQIPQRYHARRQGMGKLLDVKGLETRFFTQDGIVHAVNGISYTLDEGETLAIVGESGCGKSVGVMSLLRLIPMPPGKVTAGEVWFEGKDLLRMSDDEIRQVRGNRIAMIFQDPMTSLNPVLTIGFQVSEALMLHMGMDRATALKRTVELLEMVGIPQAANRVDDYPHQFSGGMRQRVMIAMGLSCNPKLIIADEPTTALDVTTQAVLLKLMKDMVDRFNTSLFLVTHNLGVVARYAQRIYVMYAGRIVESGTAKDIFANPRHPYTVGLLKSVPRLDQPRGRKLVPIVGMPPNLINRPAMCAFLPRCTRCIEKCQREPWPALEGVQGQHHVACYLSAEHPAPRAVQIEENGQRPNRTATREILVQVKDLRMYFPVTEGLLRRKVADVKAVDGVSFELKRGETLGMVGESGCGKTTTGRCVLRVYRPTQGQILFQGQDISSLSKSRVRPFRCQMSLIFQDPCGSLDPRQSAGDIVGEPLKIHCLTK